MAVEPLNRAEDVLPNLRDLGGLPTDQGGRTRYGVLMRSAAPLTGDRDPLLRGWPPAAVLDLRGSDELGGEPHPLAGPGTAIHAVPLLEHRLTGPEKQDWAAIPDLATAYQDFLRAGAPRLAGIVAVAAGADGAVLVHCAAGKDRTGVVVAALLRAVGVSREAIIEDYRATEPALPAILARTSTALTEAFDPTVVQRLMGVPVEAIVAVLDTLDAPPGGAAGYLRERGVSNAALLAWRQRILG
jgi:hypothetical protein